MDRQAGNQTSAVIQSRSPHQSTGGAPGPARAERRILVVEDDALVRYALVVGLRDAGYGVREADAAEAALMLIEAHAPAMALLDMRLPDRSGLDVAQVLREYGIPFLFLSAYGDEETVAKAVEAGALGYLVKPLDVAQVIPSIETALSRAAEIAELRRTEEQLSTALRTSREISMAVGLLMERHALTAEAAFELLRAAARRQRRKVAELAEALVEGREQLG